MSIDKRKVELREYIEARAKSSQGHMTLYRRDHDHGYISYDVEDESMTAFMTTLLDCDQPKAKQNAEFTVLAANESAKIAEQLLECIVFIEMLQCEYYYSIDGKMQRHFDDCKRCKILNKIVGEK